MPNNFDGIFLIAVKILLFKKRANYVFLGYLISIKKKKNYAVNRN